MYPEKYRYSKEHEWLEVDGDVAVLGITHHAQDQLGDIVFVEMPEPGDEFSAGDEFGSVESVKAVAEVFMPVTCEIMAINEALEDEPELVNKEPHGNGWLVKIKLSELGELENLMDHQQYTDFVAEESK